jgi:hypothetical protein
VTTPHQLAPMPLAYLGNRYPQGCAWPGNRNDVDSNSSLLIIESIKGS